MSHDINNDHEVWELTDTFGDRSLRIWLEILSIADRNGGELPAVNNSLLKAIAFKCHTRSKLVQSVFNYASKAHWTDIKPTFRVVNFAKYHRIRGRDRLPSEPSVPSVLKEVAETATHPAEKKTKRNQEIERIFTMAKEIAGRDKQRAKQLCDFVGKTIKGGIKFGDSEEVVHAAILDTFQMLKAKAEKDGHPIEEVLLWPYLQTTYKYRRTTELTRESDRYKKAGIGSFGEILDQIKFFKSA